MANSAAYNQPETSGMEDHESQYSASALSRPLEQFRIEELWDYDLSQSGPSSRAALVCEFPHGSTLSQPRFEEICDSNFPQPGTSSMAAPARDIALISKSSFGSFKRNMYRLL
ncbi:uncharacterized protein LOC129739278 [Uranotaenia lowii]|uniref:uncharacterized protein LOC129739278 n=1 Tax=Uranotaenia lowii TaxID=190385 RepID=UPI00247A1D2E|nr:uncharacterized protein LOC129739278 [Uranotaenia lowii]